MSRLLSTLECFVKKGDKYLMLHRSKHKRIMPGIWMAPGGKREFNEGLFEATRREIREETNLEIKNIQIKATGNAYVADIDQEFVFHMLTAEYVSGEVEKDTEDGTFEWITKDEINRLRDLLPELKDVIDHILSDTTEVISYKALYKTRTEMTFFEIEKP